MENLNATKNNKVQKELAISIDCKSKSILPTSQATHLHAAKLYHIYINSIISIVKIEIAMPARW